MKRGPETKTPSLFLWHIFVDFMDKEPCTKFCGVLIRFREVVKLQSFEFNVSDVIPVVTPVFFKILFLVYREKTSNKVLCLLTIFYELMKLRSFVIND